jgi:TPP-dependent 2-oxoacid decarboxylase
MFMDKSVLDEQQPGYVEMYDGVLMNENVRAFVENCDGVLAVGARLTDFNSGTFTARLEPERTISVSHHHTRVGGKIYPNVEMGDILTALAHRFDEARLESAGSQLARRSPEAGPIRLLPQHFIHAGQTFYGPATSLWPILARLQWASASPICLLVPPSITRRFGAPLAGPLLPHSARR